MPPDFFELLVVVCALGVALVGVLAVAALVRVNQLAAEVRRLTASRGAPVERIEKDEKAASALWPAVQAVIGPSVEAPPGLAPPDVAAATPAEVPAAPPAAAPARPFDWESVVGGRWLQRVGLLTIAIGVAYFLKEAVDNAWIGPTGQVSIGILLGIALLAGGDFVRRKAYFFFADGLTALGVVVLYLSVWAGGSYYQLFPLGAAFVAMAAITAATVAIAVGRNSQPVAVLAMLGGFMTPVLVSTGRDAHVALFSYVAVLNAALLPIAWLRRWRWLDVPAFVLTQMYLWGWYAGFYTAEALPETIAFATIFFLEFAAVPLLRSRRDLGVAPEHVVLVPVNAGLLLLVLRATLWPDHRWALTFGALAIGAAHLFAAQLVPRRDGKVPAAGLLFGGVALTAFTLAIPIRLDGRWITIGWAVEGAVLAWSGFRAGLPAMRALALVVLGIVCLRLLAMPEPASAFLFNPRLLSELVSIACLGVVLWAAREYGDRIGPNEKPFFQVLALVVNLLAIRALTLEVGLYYHAGSDYTGDMRNALAEELTISILWSVYASLLLYVGLRQQLAGVRWQALALFGATTLKVFFFDLSYLSGFYRIGSSIALGVVLLAVSFFYQRRLAAARAAETP
jgi:uncharacterized membrane protein